MDYNSCYSYIQYYISCSLFCFVELPVEEGTLSSSCYHCMLGIVDGGITVSKWVLALDLEGVHDLKLHHPSSSVAMSNQ